jgi:hypothetical protein
MGDTQIPIVVADDMTFVEHPGNAGRPLAAVSRPIPSLRRPSGWSRSYGLASLRRSTLTNACGPAPHAMRALTDNPTQVTRRRLLGRPVPEVPVDGVAGEPLLRPDDYAA